MRLAPAVEILVERKDRERRGEGEWVVPGAATAERSCRAALSPRETFAKERCVTCLLAVMKWTRSERSVGERCVLWKVREECW